MQSKQSVHAILTPDGDKFSIKVISRKDANGLEGMWVANRMEDDFLKSHGMSAFGIDHGKVLFRQFMDGDGFVFSSINDFNKGRNGASYYDVTFLLTDSKNSLSSSLATYTRIAASFALLPAAAHQYRKRIVRELTNYSPFEGNRFYVLDDHSIVMLRNRTNTLSDGYWFADIADFDYYYYVYSGKDRPASSNLTM